MTVERSSLGAEFLASRPLTDNELEERYGQRLRPSDDWFELYEEPPIELPLSPRRKYLVPVVGALVVGAAVLTGYALQKNDWRAVFHARQSLEQTFGPKLPPMTMEPLALRDRVDYVPLARPGMIVQLSAARAEFSHYREPSAAEAPPGNEVATEVKAPPPRRRAAARSEPKADNSARPRSEGSPLIEAPVAPLDSEPNDSAGSRSIEAPAQPENRPAPSSEPKDEAGPEDEPNPYERATPPAADYGI